MDSPIQIEYKLRDKDTLYFLHIPKTAGGTLISYLDENFDLDQICRKHYWSEWFDDIPRDFSRYRLYRGELGVSLNKFLNKKPMYLTVLRDPLKRTISHFETLRRVLGPAVIDFFSKSNEISDFITDPHYGLMLKNVQTRYLSLELDVPKILESIEYRSKDFLIESISEFLSPNLSDSELIQIAKKNLASSAFVGIVEKFEESLFLLYYTFGWKPKKTNLQKNKSNTPINQKEISEKTISKILDFNKLDKELYEYGKNIFEKRYSLMVNTLKEKYYESKFNNISFNEMMYELLEKNYEERTYRDTNNTNQIELYFHKKLVGTGWHSRENHNDTGKIFRWTGPEKISTIDLPLSRENDLIIEFRVLMSITPEILKNLKVKINNYEINLKILFNNQGITTFQGIISKHILQNGKNFSVLSFHVPKTLSPHDINKNLADKRKIGMAIDYIKIKSIV
ncbi:sulfotransferase family 2 domain-containing protein [Nitrosopumilus piranensis]|uniref:Sulfotransferase family protein n=1 Tax=Nitrosopumilus piranensis TaxID=1582439 RepID=A0A0C5BWA3_9ARCH|nr:sulfotransferase family 2 domain-containing protein [Nitrosopumilus piranensis]AJM91255.1 hypothetical protein NPIRD3C_0031 [Nitrosopumilus piranensis]